jgi:hypothetical protein
MVPTPSHHVLNLACAARADAVVLAGQERIVFGVEPAQVGHDHRVCERADLCALVALGEGREPRALDRFLQCGAVEHGLRRVRRCELRRPARQRLFREPERVGDDRRHAGVALLSVGAGVVAPARRALHLGAPRLGQEVLEVVEQVGLVGVKARLARAQLTEQPRDLVAYCVGRVHGRPQ